MNTDQSPQKPIAAVIFDLGGVISNDPFKVMATEAVRHGFDLGEFAVIAIGHGDYGAGDHPWHQLERGEIDVAAFEQATDELAKERGHDGFPPFPVDLILTQALKIRPEMLELLADVRAQGIATAILTNNVRALGAWRNAADWDQLVDAVFDSCEVGMRKPEPRIFDHACSVLGVSPVETVFLDDLKVNVDAAVDLGFTGILVTDPIEAITEVHQLIGA